MIKNLLICACFLVSSVGCVESSGKQCGDRAKIVGDYKKISGNLTGVTAGDSGFGYGPTLSFQSNGLVNNNMSGGFCDYCLEDSTKLALNIANMHSHVLKHEYITIKCGQGSATPRIDFTDKGFTMLNEAYNVVTKEIIVSNDTATYEKIK